MKSLLEIMTPFYNQIKLKNPETLRNKSFLITGASGLVGSNLTTYLHYLNQQKRFNINIIAVVRSGIEEWMPKSKMIHYIQQDLSTIKLDPNIECDFLIHLATYGQPKKFLTHPKETVLLNIDVLINLLDLAKKFNATFLYPSSSEVYGEADQKNIPTDESYFGNVNTLSERALYAEAKRLGETICFWYTRYLKVKIARLLICYGPGVKYDDQRVYSEFIKKAQINREIIMMDKGKAERSLCFISDAIEMLLNILLSSKEIVYNVCGIQSVKIKKLAQIIADINRVKVSKVEDKKIISGTPKKSTLSNRKYVKEFGKGRFVTLVNGLRVTSDWFKNLRGITNG